MYNDFISGVRHSFGLVTGLEGVVKCLCLLSLCLIKISK